MCGIVGILDLQGRRPIDEQLLIAMNDAQHHRGPDQHGVHVEPGLGLGHRRLSIIDLGSGRQPLYNEDGSVVVVYNGEIYNFGEVREELLAAGHRFTTDCDTEIIVHGWEEWGAACVERFRGMFAFALWDRGKRQLFLARDRIGKKPLYYSLTRTGLLVFASELKALLVHPEVERELDPQAVEDYFTFAYIPDPRSIYRDVRKLEAGHLAVVDCARERPALSPRPYWDLQFTPAAPVSEAAAAEELIARLDEAVRLRMIADVPLGAFLSGGVDSSAIVALMARGREEPVTTCSISFTDPQYDESAYAREVAARYRTRHFVDECGVDDFGLLDTLVDVYDEPFADSSAIPTYRVCEAARRHVTVALSGDGGDEGFAGYRRYRWHMREEAVRGLLPQALRGPLFGALGSVYPKWDWMPSFLRAKSTLQALARSSVDAYLHNFSLLPDGSRDALYSASFRRALGGYHAREVFLRHLPNAPADPLALVQYLDFKTYLPGDILVKVDRASMAHSLEVRVPILDHRFVEWHATLPSSLKLRDMQGKYLFKKALEPYLSQDILYRRKMGFAVPVGRWFRGPLRERVKAALTGAAMGDAGLFDMGRLARMADEHASGQRDHAAALWALLMFEGFLRRHGAIATRKAA